MKVSLSPKQIERCFRYGQDVVADYAAGGNVRSLKVSGDRGVEKDPIAQARGRMAEWAVCKFLNVYPGELGWGMKADCGYDLIAHGARIDVKHTRHPFGRFLVWSIDVWHLFNEKQFDVLFGVRGIEPDFEITGWITKQDFRAAVIIAPDGHRLVKGTPFVPIEILHKPATFGDNWSAYRAMEAAQ